MDGVVGFEFERPSRRCRRELRTGEDCRVALLAEVAGGGIGAVASAGEEDIQQQTPPRCETLGGQLEHSAELVGAAEVGGHFRKHDQPVVTPEIVAAGEDIALNHPHGERLAPGLLADRLGELRRQFDRIERMSAPGQGQGVATGTGADVENRQAGRIVGRRGQSPDPGIGLGAEQRRLTGGQPVVVGRLQARPLRLDVVVHHQAHRRVVGDDDLGAR